MMSHIKIIYMNLQNVTQFTKSNAIFIYISTSKSVESLCLKKNKPKINQKETTLVVIV